MVTQSPNELMITLSLQQPLAKPVGLLKKYKMLYNLF